MKKTTYSICLGLLVFWGLSFFLQVSGYQIEDLNFTAPPTGDFSLAPGKVELWMNPGEKLTKELLITNRIGRTVKFKIEIEDFEGSQNPERAVVLLGEKRGSYSLKDYLHPEISEFTLEYGERMTLPVEISIPRDAKPGGLYALVLIAIKPRDELEKEKIKAPGEVRIISRLGSLFFVRVKGETTESGFLRDFKVEKSFYEKGPVSFELLFENNGSVHLVPYGIIEIKNFLGIKKSEIELAPWFVMPDSSRLKTLQWEKGLMFGRYTANIKINRGYQDIIDEKSIVFWVIPWKIILAGLIILTVIICILLWFANRFEIKRKTLLICLIFLFIIGNYPAFAYVMESDSYRIQSDSLNIGGSRWTSDNYIVRDTVGEITTGPSASTSYKLKAGYQQMQEVYLSISAPGDITMTGNIQSLAGGVATGEMSWIIITDNPAGYNLSVKSDSTSPAMQGQIYGDTFVDYTPASSGTPDYSWSIADSTTEFGFSPEGSHIVQKFKDNGVDTCNTGSSDTSDKCWYGFSTSNETIANSYSSNHPSGTSTTIKLKAQLYNEDGTPNNEAGMLTIDSYQATITATAVAN